MMVLISHCASTVATIPLSIFNPTHTELIALSATIFLGISLLNYIHLSLSPCQMLPWANLSAYFCSGFPNVFPSHQTHIAHEIEGQRTALV
jgi:hypothetical protein